MAWRRYLVEAKPTKAAPFFTVCETLADDTAAAWRALAFYFALTGDTYHTAQVTDLGETGPLS